MTEPPPDDETEKTAFGGRWREYKADAWSRTDNKSGVGFVQDEKLNDPTYDWTASRETRIEYFDNIEQQYTYFCYGEKDYEACQKRAELLQGLGENNFFF